jgi:hypothetical protein
MAVQLSLETLKLYFIGQAHHRAYAETVQQYEKLKTHADGLMPTKLIEERRPSESKDTLEYRKKIYVPKTKNPIGKVVSSLSKIRRSPDWSIKYDKKAFPSSIIEEETLEEYCEKNYPGQTSITNWIFSVLLKNQSVDGNAVIAVLPMNIEASQTNEYYKPIAILFNSNQVLFYEEGAEYAILRSSERSSLTKPDANGNLPNEAKVFYVITTNEFQKWEETSAGSEFQMTQQLVHAKNKLPAFKIRAQFLKQKENTIIQESRIAPMIPSLDEAAREYSDLQAAVVQHMHPLFYYIQSKECKACNGTGKTTGASGMADCQQCYDENLKASTGRIKFSPYAHIQVDPPAIGDKSVPMPPAGYVTRDVEIMKLQDERVKTHLYEALASVNMQFLDQTPLNVSGKAKEVDREELNNFVYSVAEDLVATMDKIYWWVNEWRYSVIVSDKTKREAMLPEICVPEQFDLLPADYLMDDISKAKTAKVNPLLVATMEEDFAVKKFYNNPELKSQISCYYELDPLPGLSVDEKMSLLSNKGVTQEDFVTSAYIVSFVKRAIAEEKDFLSKPLAEKQKVISKYAQEKVKVTDAAEKVKQEMLLKQQQQMQEQFPAGN